MNPFREKDITTPPLALKFLACTIRMPGLMIMEVPEHLKAPGTWMHDALGLRDQWESRLLRSTRWSPLA